MKKPAFFRRSSFQAATALMLISINADAVTSTWIASPTTNNLDLATNYSRSPVAAGPGLTSGDTIAFGVSSVTALNNNLANGFLVNGINFNAGASAYTITGANSIATNTNIANNSSNTQTLNTGLILTGGNINVSTAAGGGNVVIGGVVSQDGSARRLAATGLGTLTLNGSTASTYTGQTSASGQGTFIVDLSNIAGGTNLINTASQLNLGNGNGAEAGSFVLRGAATGISSQTFNGFLLAAGTTGSIMIDPNGGAGTTLNLGTSVSRSAGSVVTFDISSANSFLTGTTLGLTAGTQTATQGIRGYALVKDATGIGFATNVNGAIVRYTGAATLTAGGSSLTTGSSTNYNLAAGGTTTSLANGQSLGSLNINTTGGAGVLDIGAGTLTNANGILVSGNSLLTIQNGTLGATNAEVLVNAIGTGGVNIASTIGGGTTVFTKAGTDTVTLSGNNTYSGNTYVIGGILKAGSSTAFSSNSVFFITQAPGAGIDLNGFDVTISSFNAGGPLNAGINLGGNTLTLGKATAFDVNSTIFGSGGITKIGSGVMQIFSSNTYTGATNINEGTVRLRNQAVNTLGVGSAVTIASGAVLDLGSTSVTVGSLAGAGSLTNSLVSSNVLTTGSNNASTTFSGVISNGATTATMITGISKIGLGNQTLSGLNTYTGLTSVTNGTLTGSQTSGTPFGTGAVTIGAGTLALAPTGSGSNVALTGGTLASGTLFTFNPGAALSLNKGTQTSLTYTFGGGGTAFARGTNGTFILSTSAIAGLGSATGERFLINGTAPTLVNTIVSGAVAQDRGNNNAGDFLGYDATNGFKAATYGLTNTFAGSTNAQLANISSATSTTGATAVYAMKVSGTLTNTGNTITLGSSGNPTAGIILNGGTINGGTITTVTSSASEFAIYVSSLGGTINSALNSATSQTGMSVFGPGTLTLTAAANSFSGGLRVNGSTVKATSDAQLGGSSSNITLTGATLETSGTFALGGATGARGIVLNAGEGYTGSTFNVTGGTTTFTSNTTGSKLISGAGSLTKTGAGTLLLTGNATNTYTGGTFINEGTLKTGSATAFSATSAVSLANTAGATFDLSTVGVTVGSLTGGGATGGNVTLGASTLTTGGSNTSTTYAGSISGSGGGLTKVGTGEFTLSGSNSHSGVTTVSAGTLAVSGGSAIADSGAVSIASGATFKLNASETTGGLSGVSGSSVNLQANTLSAGDSASNTFAGVISGTGGFTSKGSGTQILTGANTYSGVTTVSAGTLLVNGSTSTGAVTVASGATLGGSGTVGGSTTISGNHAPGNAAIGNQTFASNLAYASGSTFSWQLGDETPAANFDTVDVGGALNIAASGVAFKVIVTGLDIAGNFWMNDRSWDIFDSASAGAGTFDSFVLYDASDLNTSVPYAGYGTFTFTPVTGVLSWNSAVPEPTNALAGLLIGAGLLRRRRRSVKK